MSKENREYAEKYLKKVEVDEKLDGGFFDEKDFSKMEALLDGFEEHLKSRPMEDYVTYEDMLNDQAKKGDGH